MDEHKSTKKIIKDTPYCTLLEESVFPSRIEIRKSYQIFYRIVNKLTFSQTLILLADSPNEIKLINAHPLRNREERKLEIQLNPFNAGPKLFQILLANRTGKHILLEKQFYAEDKSSLKIEGMVKKNLPPSMKLGEEHEVIFLFENKGHQIITGVTINIEAIKEG